jgi:acetolactate synthase I/II/III large subunit
MIKVSDFIVKYLESIGVSNAFLVTGGGAMHLNDSFGKSEKIKCIYNHHEQACAIAAEGYARQKQDLAVVNVTTGPGGLNTLNGVFGQWTDSVPVLYVSGQVRYDTTIMSCPELGLRQLGDQEVDIISVVKPLTKYAVCISDAKNVKKELQKAVYLALNGRPGPVWIDVPMNIQGALVEESELENYIPEENSLFTDNTNNSISQIIELLKTSVRPVIVAGQGVRLSNTIAQLKEILRKTNLPVLSTLNGFDIINWEHPQHIGTIGTIGSRAGNFAIQNADLVLFLGTRNNIRQISYNWPAFARAARKVCIDIDEAELKKPLLTYDLAICDDLKNIIPQLNAAISLKQFDFSEWLNWCLVRKKKYNPVLDSYRNIENCVNPYVFMEELSYALPETSTVVTANATACICYFQAAKIKSKNRVIWNSGCASMGYDLPAAIGASIASPLTEIICLAGDGSLQMNIQELATVNQYQLPIKLFYLNNDGYISMKQTQDNFFGRRVGADKESGVSFPDINKIADANDLPFKRISNDSNLKKEIQAVLAMKGPVICEVILPTQYNFAPKLSSEKKPDGRMVSKPMEDMFPFLSREEFLENMIIPTINE